MMLSMIPSSVGALQPSSQRAKRARMMDDADDAAIKAAALAIQTSVSQQAPKPADPMKLILEQWRKTCSRR